MLNRRSFIKNAALGAVVPTVLNGFPVKAFSGSSWLHALTNTNIETDHVLVLINLAGGNDGLNMVIPLDQYSNLANARNNILIPDNQVLSLNGYAGTGLHPAMTGIRQLFNDSKLQIIQGVGYPEQNFSHFRSTDIWLTASDSDEVFTSGWTGRYLEYEYPNFPNGYPNEVMPDPLAIQIGGTLSTVFMGTTSAMGMTITSATDFYNLVSGIQDPAPDTPAGKELTYVRLVSKQTQLYTDVIAAAANGVTSQGPYPDDNKLAQQLKIVARLIKGGLKTRVYMVSMDQFDTHSDQVDSNDTTTGQHANLLSQLSVAISSFMGDLEYLGIQNRVVGFTFSEFGRRIKSNASLGTDHGAANPMFVFGHPVNSGIIGNNPQIPTNVSVDDNVPMQYDFRSVYSTILKDWFCVPDTDIGNVMLHNFQYLPIIKDPGNCAPDAVRELNQLAGLNLISNHPNPFDFSTTIRFTTQSGHTSVTVFNAHGQLIDVVTDNEYPAGTYDAYYNGEHLPAGTYYCRLQNGMIQQVKTMVKVR